MQLLKTEWDASRTAKARVTTKPHYHFEWPRSSGGISDDWKRKKRKEKRQNISTRRIQETTGKVIPIHLEAISRHTKVKKVTGNTQHRFTNGKIMPNQPDCLLNETTVLVKKRAMYAI